MMSKDEIQQEVWTIKDRAQAMGLDFYPVEFEVISRQQMIEFGAYVLPSRYSHWTFGKYYGKMKQLQNLGALEILEMVLNSDPAKAYLLDSNSRVENMMVIAHVYGHVDFFKNNYWFSKTNKHMIREAEYHEKRLRELEYDIGQKEIEEFLDICISIQWHCDFWGQFCDPKAENVQLKPLKHLDLGDLKEVVICPDEKPESLFDLDPDLLQYLITNADLEPWKQEVLKFIRDEMLYFMPNAMTKIMNEGWATMWQEIILRDYLDFTEFDQFAIKHSEVIASHGLNPYRLGYMIYLSIIKRWDEKEGIGAGLAKALEVRRYYNDVQFIREFLTQEVCEDCGLFVYEKPGEHQPSQIVSTDVELIKEKLLIEIINFGKPVIVVKMEQDPDDDHLHLLHKFDGRELNIDHATDVITALYKIWQRPVHLETVIKGERSFISFDGEDTSIDKIVKEED